MTKSSVEVCISVQCGCSFYVLFQWSHLCFIQLCS